MTRPSGMKRALLLLSSHGMALGCGIAIGIVETEADFARVKPRMVRVGDVKTFDNFLVPVPEGIDIERFNAVIVWCETFGQFITAARYR